MKKPRTKDDWVVVLDALEWFQQNLRAKTLEEVRAWIDTARAPAAEPAICVPVAKLLKIRDSLIANDVPEAYHALYSIASPNFDKLEPWATWDYALAPPEAAQPAAERESPSYVERLMAADVRAKEREGGK